MRPYNSLPRGQDINNYPSLAIRKQSKDENKDEPVVKKSEPPPRRSPSRRAYSEDVYAEKTEPTPTQAVKEIIQKSMETEQKPPKRINPLMKLMNTDNRPEKAQKSSPRRRTQKTDTPPNEKVEDSTEDSDHRSKEAEKKHSSTEKRVSFESTVVEKTIDGASPTRNNVNKSQSTIDCGTRERKSQSEDDDDPTPVELCDIEPLSGTVFRKVTVRRRRQEMRKIPAVDSGESFNFVLPLAA